MESLPRPAWENGLSWGYNKNYAPLGHVPILVRNLHALSGIAFLTHVIIAVAPKELTEARALLQKYEAAFSLPYLGPLYQAAENGRIP